MMKDRILKELGCILDPEEPVGFFSFTVSKTRIGKIVPTVTFICDEALPDQRKEISAALFNLFDAIKPIFLANRQDTEEPGEQSEKANVDILPKSRNVRNIL